MWLKDWESAIAFTLFSRKHGYTSAYLIPLYIPPPGGNYHSWNDRVGVYITGRFCPEFQVLAFHLILCV